MAWLNTSLRSPPTLAGTGHVGELGVGSAGQEVLGPSSLSRSLLRPRTSSVGTRRASTARPRRPGSTTDEQVVGRAELAEDEGRVPVPDPAAVGTAAQVLRQARQVGR